MLKWTRVDGACEEAFNEGVGKNSPADLNGLADLVDVLTQCRCTPGRWSQPCGRRWRLHRQICRAISSPRQSKVLLSKEFFVSWLDYNITILPLSGRYRIWVSGTSLKHNCICAYLSFTMAIAKQEIDEDHTN